MAMYREVSRCRICGGRSLRPILDLGMQALTGVFPATAAEPVSAAPLELVLCDDVAGCGLTPRDLPAIAEVNPTEFGCVTPGTGIPILPEHEVHAMRPDVLLVLPWHFRQAIVAREQLHLHRGGTLLFPLPRIEMVGHGGLRRAA